MRRRTAFVAATLAAALGLGGCEGGEDALSVVVSLPQQQAAGVAKATVLVDYSGTGAKILAEGGGPACAFILPGVEGDFADDRQGTLTIHTTGARALRGPADLAACRMKAGDENATAAELREKLSVRVASAEDAAGKAIDVEVKSSRGGGPGKGMTPQAIEEAQEAAVKAAAAAAPPPSPRPPLTPADANPGSPRAGMSAPQTASAAAAAAAAAAQRQTAASRPTTPANRPSAVPSGSAPGGQGGPVADGSDIPGNQDRDPSYDDKDADDETVPAYNLEFAAAGSGSFGALQLTINHLGRSGGFIGRGDAVDCVSMVEAIVASNYVGERVAKIGLISLAGIRLPAKIMRCGFRTREALSPSSFDIQVVDASNTDSKPLDPAPTVVIQTISRR